MEKLFSGLWEYQSIVHSKRADAFRELAKGQSPHTFMITCSDSRIDPNLVTQSQPGEIFLLRNAGNIVPAYGSGLHGETATIEFAVLGLQVRNIVICGHRHCGAMAGLAGKVNLESLPAMRRWLEHARAAETCLKGQPPQANCRDYIEENVLVQVQNLKTHPAVYAGVRAQELNIFGWNYDFESGDVSMYHTKENKFISFRKDTDMKLFNLASV